MVGGVALVQDKGDGLKEGGRVRVPWRCPHIHLPLVPEAVHRLLPWQRRQVLVGVAHDQPEGGLEGEGNK